MRPSLPLLALSVLSLVAAPVSAQEPTDDDLSATVERLARELARVQAELAARAEVDAALLEEIEALRLDGGAAGEPSRFSLGGYGEVHANLGEGSGKKLIDFHRVVLYLGYAFSDWITLHSEFEIEHAFVANGNGELLIEQLYFDFDLAGPVDVRAGRMLAPLGIVNERHEPPTFHGVERPSVEKHIIPSTWSVDGVGLVGTCGDAFAWQLYGVAGLDGSRFDSRSALRGGRIKERPGLQDPAATGRVDWRPLVACDTELDLRLGLGAFVGGGDNVNKGGTTGVDSDLFLGALDAEASCGRYELRGVVARGGIDDAAALNNAFGNDVGTAFGGWYVEGAVHVLPEHWRSGRLAEADAVAFARYERYDTQRDMPTNAAADPAARRDELTVGLDLFLTPNVVVKADWQALDDRGNAPLGDQLNLGIGWIYR